jgi:hypothetical protein
MDTGATHTPAEFRADAKKPTPPRDTMSRNQRSMMDRSTKGSPPFTRHEFATGYRRIS